MVPTCYIMSHDTNKEVSLSAAQAKFTHATENMLWPCCRVHTQNSENAVATLQKSSLKTARALFMFMTLDEAYLVTPDPSAGIYRSPQWA
ncbi:hypothetical protein E2C01_007608 [Portunus trituberculatus]|uniref:Uncharacterized protein n=1 Tax=Portunus trituberculatus TaxID=210409 RepID=A0A5B7CYL8_PORTR|nr:hypothetical protein [Portunus trituberculatus]